jgi:DNA-binding transcriptional LysR family regulator
LLIVLAPRRLADRHPHDLLRDEPLIRYDRNQWGGLRAEEYLRRAGIRPRERFELNALNSIAVMVDRGLGVSLVPDWSPPWPEGLDLARLALPEPCVGRRVGIVWSRATLRMGLLGVLLDESVAANAGTPGPHVHRRPLAG